MNCASSHIDALGQQQVGGRKSDCVFVVDQVLCVSSRSSAHKGHGFAVLWQHVHGSQCVVGRVHRRNSHSPSASHSSGVGQSYELEQRTSGFTGLWVDGKAVSNSEHVASGDGSGHRALGQSQSGRAFRSHSGAGAGNAAVVKAGDVFTVADCFAVNPQTRESTGSLFQFVALADATAVAGTWSVTVAPMYSATQALATVSTLPLINATVTFIGAASTAYAQNLVYHKDAITFATADLLLPQGVDMAARAVHNGISLRVVRQYDINNDRLPCRIDVLYGFSTIRPQMACRIWG